MSEEAGLKTAQPQAQPPSTEGGEPARPEWLLETFKTPEEQAKGYAAALKQMQAKEAEAQQKAAEAQRATAQLQQWYGQVQDDYDYDPQTGNLVRRQATGTPATQEPEPADDDYPTFGALKKMQEKNREDMRAAFQEALGPILGIVSQTSVDSVFRRYGNLPQEVQEKAQALLQHMTPQQRLDPNAVDFVVKAAVGEHILAQQQQPAGARTQPPAFGQPNTTTRVLGEYNLSEGRGSVSGERPGPSPDDEAARKLFGMSAEEWEKQKTAVGADRQLNREFNE